MRLWGGGGGGSFLFVYQLSKIQKTCVSDLIGVITLRDLAKVIWCLHFEKTFGVTLHKMTGLCQNYELHLHA